MLSKNNRQGELTLAESVTIAAYVLHRAVQRDDKREKGAHEIEVSMVEYSLHVQVVLWPCFQHVLAMFSACSVLVFHGLLCVGLMFVFVFDSCSNLV